MKLSKQQKRICEQVLNVFETGSAKGDYSNISIFRDGPNNIRQITYGRSQTTEYGNLRKLVFRYVEADGKYSEALKPFANEVGSTSFVNNEEFKNLLIEAGKDPIMRATQDKFFYDVYYKPALKWAKDQGFKEALSMLVIYDSFIHSGKIHWFLRQRFSESPPSLGGDEKTWIKQYVSARHDWLKYHSRPILRKTIYSTQTFKNQISRGNWNLEKLPINANVVKVSGESYDSPENVIVVPSESQLEIEVAEVGSTLLPSGEVSLKQIRDYELHVDFADLGRQSYRTLAEEIQSRLIFLGFLDPPIDGRFGPQGKNALNGLRYFAPITGSNTINASVATALLQRDPFEFLAVDEEQNNLAGKIYRYMVENGMHFSRFPEHLNIVYLEGAFRNGMPNFDRPNRFNDRRLLLRADDGEIKIVGNWGATTEPGRYWTENPMNPKGAARIKFGQYKAWSVGIHLKDDPAARHEALVQVEDVTVHRDLNKDYERAGDRLDTGIFGINQHWGYDNPVGDIGTSSAGCLVGRTRSDHRDFMSLLKNDARYEVSQGYEFYTTIISARDL